jgi:hypothetical protein
MEKMRIAWRVPLIWPFYATGTAWHSKPHRRGSRWRNPLYWLTGLALLELELWLLLGAVYWAGRGCLLACRVAGSGHG